MPIVSLAILALQKVTGYEFSSAEFQMVSDALLSLMILLGFAASPTVDKDEE